ncbi:1-(5-phosphoribosyl)-5-[(5-phosphoribosylamino)methylideneamino]imidazole-4-carboxamide isomerase [Shimazuella alba]|uniref:1-(5-phosphoribosyl)-5-[(5-phosphoribosylamino)methylideneamino] imidazole-4-carboxamide isomerase n=1 Tax=Shimazuella alba TaxID=2690964 RepID=A0A6I4VQU3_9BACL|nr:1-(5-phosphoribosyl)-5-[(5-phosphoribosylamino)methylideneamino]imidazole-4-carboxamide isomerase [Shimazuella alba]MXQ52748.1 1-(5-phosphoribosyl)-5-[(5-phosphoribosylamino)methylideneamino]imidazole-4-carboxamide isomerase [Shimazuella alba]
MGFTIYPAIDIRNGKCVRLIQGDYNQETIFHDQPLEMAQQWVAQGAKWLHLVDLDGARSGELTNSKVIKEIVRETGISIQVGGGVRDMDRLEYLLSIGVTRVIIGSAAIDNPSFVKEALAKYADQIAIGLDARDGYVATHGWLNQATVTAEELAKQMAELGAATFIVTDIAKDGLLSGVNGDIATQIANVSGAEVIASGGVATINDIKQLKTLESRGVTGVIVGKALYMGSVNLADALEEANR